MQSYSSIIQKWQHQTGKEHSKRKSHMCQGNKNLSFPFSSLPLTEHKFNHTWTEDIQNWQVNYLFENSQWQLRIMSQCQCSANKFVQWKLISLLWTSRKHSTVSLKVSCGSMGTCLLLPTNSSMFICPKSLVHIGTSTADAILLSWKKGGPPNLNSRWISYPSGRIKVT